MSEEDKTQEKTLQQLIWRMSLLSFAIKFIASITVLTFIAYKRDLLLVISIIPFWYLDACFLSYERIFRNKYNEHYTLNDKSTLVGKWVFPYRKTSKWRCFISHTLLVYYLNLIFIMVITNI